MSFGYLKLRKRDWDVIHAFLAHYPAESKNLETNGARLNGLWMGGSGIAHWQGERVVFTDLGSRSAQTVQRAIVKVAPRNWLGGFAGARGPELDPQQEAMLDEVVLMAVNEGRYYPDQPAISVEQATKEYIKIKIREMQEDAQVIRRAAVREVSQQWRSR